MRIEHSKTTKVFTIFNAPKLDPVTVVLQDIAPGHGRLIVECYGEAWAAYWGGMGVTTSLSKFVVDSGPDYLLTKLSRPKMTKRDEAYLHRIVVAVQGALRAEGQAPVDGPAALPAETIS